MVTNFKPTAVQVKRMKIMNKNEIKKALYKEKPIAKRTDRNTSDRMINSTPPYDRYVAYLNSGDKAIFSIPHYEQGENLFKDTEPSQLLIRWLI